jgi:hypothetical protein
MEQVLRNGCALVVEQIVSVFVQNIADFINATAGRLCFHFKSPPKDFAPSKTPSL